MNLENITLLILETIDMTQTLVIGTYLMFTNNKNKSSLLYLGLFLLTISTVSFINIIDFIHLNFPKYQSYKIPYNIYIIIPVFLLMYIRKVGGTTVNKISKLIYLPIVFEILLGSLLILCYQNEISEILHSTSYAIYQIFLLLYFLFLVSYCFIQIRKHSKALNKQYSSIENRSLAWVNYLLISVLVYVLISLIIGDNISDYYFELFNIVFWLLTSMWIIYNGLKQQNTVNLMNNSNTSPEEKDHTVTVEITSENTIEEKLISVETDIKTSSIDDDKDHKLHKDIFIRIDGLVKSEKLYLNKELTIADIANNLNIHPRLASTSINKCFNQNFNRYINSFRVEHAKELLGSDISQVINIEIIGSQSGFKSNSSFYNSFKSAYSKTPLQFVKERLETND